MANGDGIESCQSDKMLLYSVFVQISTGKGNEYMSFAVDERCYRKKTILWTLSSYSTFVHMIGNGPYFDKENRMIVHSSFRSNKLLHFVVI